MKQRQQQPSGQSKQHKLTKAVTHIRLGEINSGKLAALDELAQVYLALCQQYITLFCTDEHPDKFRAPAFPQHSRNAGTGLPSSKRQVLPNRGAPTEHRHIRTTRTRLLSMVSSGLALFLTLMQENPNGESGAFPRSSKRVFRLMSTLWYLTTEA
jgi:hypothetical protein